MPNGEAFDVQLINGEMMCDAVDQILAQWERERPDIDATSMGILGRMSRFSVAVGARYREFWREHGLAAGEFDVLATLRRAGDPHMLTAGALSRSLMVTGGAITARIDRLIAKGLVDRREDPANRRSMLISLTPEGVELIDRILPEHVANQRKMLSALSVEQQQQLTELLRVMLAGLETDSHAE